MHKQLAAITILAVSILTAGCSDSTNHAVATGPSAALQLSSSQNNPFARIDPSPIGAAPFRGLGVGCPHSFPYRARVNLTIFADHDVSRSLLEVRMHFVDTFGIAAPAVTLPAPLLIRQFGTALVDARSSRTFPIDFDFGCGTDRRGTLTVHVRTRDGRGRHDDADLRVGID